MIEEDKREIELIDEMTKGGQEPLSNEVYTISDAC